MLRNQNKRWASLVGLAAVLLLHVDSAKAQNPDSPALASAPAGDVRARMWAATARFVYADDQALNKMLPSLFKTIDSSSVAGFGAGLQKAVALEKTDQKHLHKFQGIFSQLSTGRNQKALPADLAKEIGNALLKNKTSAEKAARLANPAFAQLKNTLQQLANPAAPVATPASLETATVVPPATEPASPISTTAGEPPRASPKEGIPVTLLLPWAALALSVLSLLVALLRGRSTTANTQSNSGSLSPSTSPASAAFDKEQLFVELRKEIELAIKNYAPAAPAAAPQPIAAAAPVAMDADATPVLAPAPVSPQLRTLFANQQPIDGLFQRNSLAGAPASYTIFELTIEERSPDQARFSVTRNPAGHAGFIGSHHTILGGACSYQFPQGNVTRIVTDVPGLAQRTAGGDWQVDQKAHIHFE